MGELHLEIYVERMKREYNVACATGKPRVAYRETITQRADFHFTHKKQTGGAGQFARVIGYVEPMEFDAELGRDTQFESVIMGGSIPSNYIPACEKVCLSLSTFMLRSLTDWGEGFLRGTGKRYIVWQPDSRLSYGPPGWQLPRRRLL